VRERVGTVLSREFYARPSVAVAPELLNKVMVAGPCRGRIVEVEAYAGPLDPASHAYRGPTARNATMFGPPGHLYVYFTYGMHFCANAVTGEQGEGQAVLLRALAPLARSLGIVREHDGTDLVDGGAVQLVDDGVAPPDAPGVSERIGITRATDRRWRWFVDGDPNVSRR